jgi:dTDP-4-dehydrorhamnose reductase
VKRILITGANGQLGQSLMTLPVSDQEIVWIATDFPELDITDKHAVTERIRIEHPDVVVNCAAFTAVDLAEKEQEKAMQINAGGPGILARESKAAGIPFIHISTDYVFTGQGCLPYQEDDPTGPQSFYGKTKLAGEEEIIATGSGIILRTSWLYSEFGKNFLLTMLRLGREKEQIGVVCDQVGSPTYAGDLARAILAVGLKVCSEIYKPVPTRVYHFCNLGVASWFDFASVIMLKAGLPCRVNPLRTEEYPLPAARPAYSVLDTRKFRDEFSFQIPYWQISLDTCLKKLSL